MQCPCPISIQDPRGNHPSVRLTVPCGKCPICLQNKRSDWSFRLNEELRTARTAWFLTLTYNDDNLIYSVKGKRPELFKRHMQLFNKRLRKSINKYEKVQQNGSKYPQMRYYAVGEYGTKTKRPHYHGIYYNIPLKVVNEIEQIWKLGQTHTGKVTPASIHYVTKYVINEPEEFEDIQNPFALMSRRPALGYNYLKRNDYYHVRTLNPSVVLNGYQQKMPRYYKDKIFTESEKEKIKQQQELLTELKWLRDYDKEWQKLQPDYIENQFKIIRKQSKSK